MSAALRAGALMIGLDGLELTGNDRHRLAHPAVGAVCLFSRNFSSHEQLKKLVASARSCVDKPLVLATDHEGGRVQRFTGRGFTRLEPSRNLGDLSEANRDAAMHEAIERGATIARQLSGVDIDMTLAPVLDIDYGRSPMIDSRCFASDPEVVAELAMAFCQGLAEHGMPTVGKHFPGHGWAKADSHLETPRDSRTLETLLATDLVPYIHLFEAGALSAVMLSHVHYTKIDKLPATYSSAVVELLRGKLGFTGQLMTDDLVMEGASVGGGMVERTLKAQANGCEMLLWCGGEPVLLDNSLEELEATDDGVSPWSVLLEK